MNTTHDSPAPCGITRREGLLSLLGTAMALAGCGGGGGGGAPAAAGGGSFAMGPISGFGSIIVNGVHFEDKAARILDDDGALHDRNELKLGMMVRVKGKPVARAGGVARADADEIKFGAELLGPIDSINTTANTLVVLGQAVQITASTIFEDVAGLAALRVNDIVEVDGFVDPATNRLLATRVELKLLAEVKAFRLQGTISELNTAAQTFKIGTLTISFAPPVDLPGNLVLANGLVVRVRLEPVLNQAPRHAIKIRKAEVEVEEQNEAEVEGTITAFTSVTDFSVNGLRVDASRANFPDGTAGIVLGARVEVEGRLVNGVLVADKVELEEENEQQFELNGPISNLNATAKTFALRGVTVDFSGSVTFLPAGRTAADLVNGANVEVKGMASPDGTKIVATRITFE